MSIQNVKARMFAASAFIAISATYNPALAQDSDGEEQVDVTSQEGETIIVTGFRQSLEDALNLKRNASGVSDSISAEDIGKSTDQNIAEALQRVTGVAIGREDGEGTEVSIRGAGANYNNVTLNGVPVSSNGENQAVDFSQFSSDILQSITINKTASAEQNEGSLGGNIVLKTFRPLSLKKDRLVLDAQARYNEFLNPGKVDPFDPDDYRLNASFAKKLFDDTLGISVVATRETQGNRRDQFETQRWRTLTYANNVYVKDDSDASGYRPYEGNILDANGNPTGVTAGRVPNQIRYEYYRNQRDRDSVTGNIQWKPSDRTELVLNATYSKQTIENFKSYIANTPRPQAGDLYVGRGVGNVPIDNNVIKAGFLVFDPEINSFTTHIYQQNYSNSASDNAIRAPGVMRLHQDEQGTTSKAFILSGEFTQQVGDFEFKLSGGRSYTKQEDDYFLQGRSGVFGGNNFAFNPAQVVNATTAATAEFWRYGYECEEQPELLCRFVVNEGLADGGDYFRPNQISLREQNYTDEIWSAYFDVDWDLDFGPIVRLQAGAKFEDRTKDNYSATTNYGNGNTSTGPFFGTLDDLTLAPYVTGTTPSNWGAAFGLDRDDVTDGWIIWDVRQNLADVLQLPGVVTPEPTLDLRAIRNIHQQVWGGYVQADFDMFDNRLFGDVGLRYAKTKVDSTGFSGFEYFSNSWNTLQGNIDFYGSLANSIAQLGINTLAGGNFAVPPPTPAAGDNSYDNWLPSINLNFAVTPKLLARAAFSKTIARPKIDNLKPGFTIGERPFNPQSAGNFGNPDLRPFAADNYDLSLEWYFATNSLFSVALFNKELSNFEEDGTFFSYWADLRSEFFDPTTQTLLPADQINFVADPGAVLLPLSGGPQQAGCMPAREEAPGTFQEVPAEAKANRLAYCDLVQVDQPRNGRGGFVRGVEAQLQHNFTWLPGILSGFGFVANYTYADSKTDEEVTLDDNGEIIAFYPAFPLEGTSKHTFNGTFFWEKDGKLIRLAYNYRTDYLINRADAQGDAWWIEGFDTLDLSASWKLSKHLTVNFQAQNLLDTVTRIYATTVRDPNLPGEGSAFDDATTVRTRSLSNTGRVYRFGVRFNF